MKATARRGGGSSLKNKQTEKRSLFRGRDPQKGKKKEKEHSRLKFYYYALNNNAFSLPTIFKRTRAEMRDTFIE